MAISVAIVKRSGLTPTGRAVVADVTFDSSYPAGGEPYTAAMFGLSKIDYIQAGLAKASATTAMGVLVDHTASTLMLVNSNGAAPAAFLETSTVGQQATVARVVAYELPNV